MIKIIVLWLLVCCTSYTLSSFSSTGVPCYLHPSADGCHYRVRPDSNNCSTPAQRESVSKRIAIVNRTLISLEQQLIRLGVIPPDNACSKLPPVENGGIIYDDLNLAPGATGRYTCYEGYTLVSFDEDGRYEYTCTEEGIWDGSVTTVPVKCQLSSEKCDLPEDIVNGTITYINNDSSNTLIGDLVVYSCLPGHELRGVSERFCLRSGNWSGDDSTCVQSEEINTDGLMTGHHRSLSVVIGASAGSVVAVLLVLTVIAVVASVAVYRKRKSKSKRYQKFEERLSKDAADHYQSFDAMKSNDTLEETVENVFGNSFENTLDPLQRSTGAATEQLIKKPRSGSSKKPSLQIIRETAIAAAAIGKEKLGKRTYRSSHVIVKDDDEDSL